MKVFKQAVAHGLCYIKTKIGLGKSDKQEPWVYEKLTSDSTDSSFAVPVAREHSVNKHQHEQHHLTSSDRASEDLARNASVIFTRPVDLSAFVAGDAKAVVGHINITVEAEDDTASIHSMTAFEAIQSQLSVTTSEWSALSATEDSVQCPLANDSDSCYQPPAQPLSPAGASGNPFANMTDDHYRNWHQGFFGDLTSMALESMEPRTAAGGGADPFGNSWCWYTCTFGDNMNWEEYNSR